MQFLFTAACFICWPKGQGRAGLAVLGAMQAGSRKGNVCGRKEEEGEDKNESG